MDASKHTKATGRYSCSQLHLSIDFLTVNFFWRRRAKEYEGTAFTIARMRFGRL